MSCLRFGDCYSKTSQYSSGCLLIQLPLVVHGVLLVLGNLKETGWFYYNNRRSAGKTYLFTATNLASCQSKADIEEEFEIHWFTPEEIDGMIANGDIVNYSLLAAWALYKAKRL